MTELLFYTDAYLRSCEAQVLSADERGIVLVRTVFYPLGGGQPGDAGSLKTEDGREVVIANTRKGDARGTVLHIIQPSGIVTHRSAGHTRRHERPKHMQAGVNAHVVMTPVPVD